MFIENVKYRLDVYIKLIASKNIDNWSIYVLKSIKIGAYTLIWSNSILLRYVPTSKSPTAFVAELIHIWKALGTIFQISRRVKIFLNLMISS